MNMEEISRAYDTLIAILVNREQLIKQRIRSSLKHFGKEERILFDSKNFNREQESIPDIMRNILEMDEPSIDEYLGVNEQIYNVQTIKEPDAADKLYHWMSGTLHFTTQKNFDADQLARAQNFEMDKYRQKKFPGSNQSVSEVREAGRLDEPFKKEYLAKINDQVKRARDELDTPFDEIYHKERKLVADIIRAQKTIKEIQEKQPDPAEIYRFNPADLDEDPNFGNMYENGSQS